MIYQQKKFLDKTKAQIYLKKALDIYKIAAWQNKIDSVNLSLNSFNKNNVLTDFSGIMLKNQKVSLTLEDKNQEKSEDSEKDTRSCCIIS